MTDLLGANAAAYAQSADDAAERSEAAWCERKHRLLRETLSRISPVDCVADVGCRTGSDALSFARAAGATEVHGFETSLIPLQRAAERGLRTHVWISGNSPCPIQDDYFDVVVAGDVIEHLFDTDIFLSELWRVIRPGGRLLVTTPNLAWWWGRLRLLFGWVPPGIGGASFEHRLDSSIDIKHLRVLPPSEWAHLAKIHGFEVEQVAGFNYPRLLRFPFWWLDDRLSGRPSVAHSALFVLRKPERQG